MKEYIRLFVEKYGTIPQVYRSPGRINIIGEHTDYNDCWCLPMGVDRYINVLISKGATKDHRIYFHQYEQSVTIPQKLLGIDYQHTGYISPIFELLEKKGVVIEPVDMLITGDIPLGAGMSSSAALCVASFYALNDLFDLGLDKMEIALLSQKVENDYREVQCGLLDQLSVLFCSKDHALQMHPATQTIHPIQFHMSDHQFILVNSMVEHELASTEYNKRRKESQEALAFIQQAYKTNETFDSLHPYDLVDLQTQMDAILYNRAMHVVSENLRVKQAVEDLKQGAWLSLGTKMFGSHESLKNLYQVSCTQLDFLVERASYIDGVIGSRMMGGGFGGCTINLVENNAVDEFKQLMKKSYLQLFRIEPEIYEVQPANGAEKVVL